MNLSQLRRAVWLRRLSDASQSRFTLLKNHHRLGWLPETAKEFRCPCSICFIQTPVFAMGSCIFLRNSILIACILARIRFLIVLRPMTKVPHLRDRGQKCVKPRTCWIQHFLGSSHSNEAGVKPLRLLAACAEPLAAQLIP